MLHPLSTTSDSTSGSPRCAHRRWPRPREKWQIIGAMDHDDWALVLPRLMRAK